MGPVVSVQAAVLAGITGWNQGKWGFIARALANVRARCSRVWVPPPGSCNWGPTKPAGWFGLVWAVWALLAQRTKNIF